MKKFSDKIYLSKNKRGVWALDTVKGCKYGMRNNTKGCYGSCYAYRLATMFDYDFSTSITRKFKGGFHLARILDEIKSIDMDFLRIGVMGDPSECWDHTIGICESISGTGKQVVIVTKHWEPISVKLYERIENLNLIINTSVSALDGYLLEYRLAEYKKLKTICRSVLRVVSCDFNVNNVYGSEFNKIQEKLFENENVIDNVLRVSNDSVLVKSGVVNIEKYIFLGKESYISRKNKDTYVGYCDGCPDRCGVNLFKDTK